MAGIFNSRTELTIDVNNNEAAVSRRGLSPATKKILVVLLSLGLVGSVAAIGVVASGSGNSGSGSEIIQGEPGEILRGRRNFNNEMATGVNGRSSLLMAMKPPRSDVEKLIEIRELSKARFGAKAAPAVPREDVCYTTECLDASLLLLRSMNMSADPCDDFQNFACGRWIEENPIPQSATRWSMFNILRDNVNNVTQRILNDPAEGGDFEPVKQVKEYYAQCTNTQDLETRGVQPLIDITNQYGGWPAATVGTWDPANFEIVRTIADIRRVHQLSVLVTAYPSLDLRNTTRSLIYLDQAGFFLSRPVLLNPTDYLPRIQAYEEYFVNSASVLVRAAGGTPNEASLRTQARNVLAFETSLAMLSSADENRTIVDRVYNPRKLNAYESSNETSLGWTEFLEGVVAGTKITIKPDEDLIVLEVDYLRQATELILATDKETVANYIHWRLVSGLLSETTQEMRDLAFEFNKVNSGATSPATRENSCAQTALNSFGMAIGVKYIEQAFNKEAKANVDLMVNNLRDSFKELLGEADWMDEETKKNAEAKANAMRQFMAFPEWLDNQTRLESEYAGLEIQGTWLDSEIEFSRWSGAQNWDTLREITNKDYWLTYPGVVNAFYSPEYNSITFPAGILAPPFYRSNGPESINYGGIGVVIGHEITHGFDDQGSQYDADGNAINWWSDEILQRFLEKAQCIIDQYSEFTVLGAANQTLNVNGDLTSGENIADNGGLRQSFKAYRNWVTKNNGGVEERRLPGLEDVSPDQLFFLGYANIWCENIAPIALENQILGDPHSPARYRILGPLQNSVTFAEKWQCPAGSNMNPVNKDKCVLW